MFSILSLIAFLSNSDRRFHLSAALRQTDLQFPRGLSLALVVYGGMPKTKSRQLIHVKRYQSLAGSPDTKCLLQSRSFSKIESLKSSLLIAEIHLLLRSAVNLSELFFGWQQHVYTKKPHFFGGGPYLSRFIATSDNEVKNQDDKN